MSIISAWMEFLRGTGARARLVEVHKKILKVIDEMEAMRREEMPVSRKKPTNQ